MYDKQTANSFFVNVQFRHMPTSEAIRSLVNEQAQRLERFGLSGGYCNVVIDEINHGTRGGIFSVSIRLKVPGERLYVATATEERVSKNYLSSAVLIAFDEITRQLKKQRKKKTRRGSDLALAFAV